MTVLTPAIFDETIQLVRMGALDGQTLHLRHAGEDSAAAIALTSEEARLLRQTDPTKFHHSYRASERELLLGMADRGMLRIILPGSGFEAFDWSLEITGSIHAVSNPFEPGYICLTGSASFDLVEHGLPLLHRMDTVRTVSEVTEEYQREVLAAGVDIPADVLARTDPQLYRRLCDAGMSLTKGIIDSGAGSCLPRRTAELAQAA